VTLRRLGDVADDVLRRALDAVENDEPIGSRRRLAHDELIARGLPRRLSSPSQPRAAQPVVHSRPLPPAPRAITEPSRPPKPPERNVANVVARENGTRTAPAFTIEQTVWSNRDGSRFEARRVFHGVPNAATVA